MRAAHLSVRPRPGRARRWRRRLPRRRPRVRDPAASLSLFPVEFTLAGKDYELPGVGARWWLEMLLANDIGMIVAAEPEGLLSVQEAAEIDLALIDGTVEMEEFRAVLYDVLSAVAGRGPCFRPARRQGVCRARCRLPEEAPDRERHLAPQ